MYCVYCGTKLPDEARFCFMCGKGIDPDFNAEGDAMNASERNNGKGVDTGEATRTESQNTLAAVNDADETTEEGARGESTSNEKGRNEPVTPSKNDADEDATVKQPSEEVRNAPEAADESTSTEDGANEPEEPSKNDAKVAKESLSPSPAGSPAPSISSDKTTVIPLAAPSDKTTILPGFGAEKAALEQEKSDEIAALAALYPEANPAQFCDPTPFEAKSPDITEFIAPAPINGAKPASAESVHYAECSKKKSAGKRTLLIAFVVIIAVLAAAAAFGMSFDVLPD